jgi:hypothetical protein
VPPRNKAHTIITDGMLLLFGVEALYGETGCVWGVVYMQGTGGERRVCPFKACEGEGEVKLEVAILSGYDWSQASPDRDEGLVTRGVSALGIWWRSQRTHTPTISIRFCSAATCSARSLAPCRSFSGEDEPSTLCMR